jgi:hypothetical protein
MAAKDFLHDRVSGLVPESDLDGKLPKGTFSYSQYSLYQKCPKAYWFSYVENLKIPPGGLQYKGQVVHRGVEAGHRSVMEKQPFPVEEGMALVADEFDKGKEAVEQWGDDGETAGQIKDTAIRSYSMYHQRALPAVNPIAVEKSFVFYINRTPVIGYIDLIDNVAGPAYNGVAAPEQLVVADLKLSKQTWSKADLEKDPQFTLYSKVTGIPTVRVDNIVNLKAGPVFKQQIAVRDGHAHLTVVEHMAETIELIHNEIYPKTSIDSWGCSEKFCGYWFKCRGKRT